MDQPLHQRALDGGVRPALDAHRRGAAPSAQQHVHDRVDQGTVHDHQAVIVPFIGLENRQHRRQRDRVQVIAEPQRQNIIDADVDIVAGKIAQAGGHNAHESIEDDFQHRQPLVGHQTGADDPLHPGSAVAAGRPVIETQQAVDLRLVQYPGWLSLVTRRIVLCSQRGREFRATHCTINSINRTSTTRVGAAAMLARAISSSRSR